MQSNKKKSQEANTRRRNMESIDEWLNNWGKRKTSFGKAKNVEEFN